MGPQIASSGESQARVHHTPLWGHLARQPRENTSLSADALAQMGQVACHVACGACCCCSGPVRGALTTDGGLCGFIDLLFPFPGMALVRDTVQRVVHAEEPVLPWPGVDGGGVP